MGPSSRLRKVFKCPWQGDQHLAIARAPWLDLLFRASDIIEFVCEAQRQRHDTTALISIEHSGATHTPILVMLATVWAWTRSTRLGQVYPALVTRQQMLLELCFADGQLDTHTGIVIVERQVVDQHLLGDRDAESTADMEQTTCCSWPCLGYSVLFTKSPFPEILVRST